MRCFYPESQTEQTAEMFQCIPVYCHIKATRREAKKLLPGMESHIKPTCRHVCKNYKHISKVQFLSHLSTTITTTTTTQGLSQVAPPTRMVGQCPLPVGLFDFVVGGSLAHSEHLVVILALALLQLQLCLLHQLLVFCRQGHRSGARLHSVQTFIRRFLISQNLRCS